MTARRAQTAGALVWSGQGYRRTLFAHQALAAMQKARQRHGTASFDPHATASFHRQARA